MGVGELGEQDAQLCGLVAGQGCQQLRFVLFGDPAQFTQYLLPGVGEVQLVVPPVGAAAGSVHQPAALKGVDERDHPAGNDAKLFRDGPLAQSGRAAQQTDDAGVAWREADLAGAVGKPGRCHGAELGQEEGCPSRLALASWVHGSRIHP